MFLYCVCCYFCLCFVVISVTTQSSFVCVNKANCSLSAEAEDSKFISCVEGKCLCDSACFQSSQERCEVRNCYSYSFGTDSCTYEGKNWRITIILAKYAGFLGGVYFYLGEWPLGVVQLLVFIVTLIAIPVIITVYCIVGCVLFRMDVELRDVYPIIKRVVVSVLGLCCVHCTFLCACIVWYVVVTLLVAQNLIKDSNGCGMNNEPTYIHVV